MGFFSGLLEFASSVKTPEERQKDELLKRARKLVPDYIKQDSITCKKCKGTAVPTYGTTNKYNCVKCGYRFSESNHLQFYTAMTNIAYSKQAYDEYVNSLTTKK